MKLSRQKGTTPNNNPSLKKKKVNVHMFKIMWEGETLPSSYALAATLAAICAEILRMLVKGG